MLKLGWELVSSNLSRGKLLKARFFINHKFISSHIHSTIWSGIKNTISYVLENSKFLIDIGNLSFQKDCLLSEPIIDLINFPMHVCALLKAIVNDFWSNNSWNLPALFIEKFSKVVDSIQQVKVLVIKEEDKLIWCISQPDGLP